MLVLLPVKAHCLQAPRDHSGENLAWLVPPLSESRGLLQPKALDGATQRCYTCWHWAPLCLLILLHFLYSVANPSLGTSKNQVLAAANASPGLGKGWRGENLLLTPIRSRLSLGAAGRTASLQPQRRVRGRPGLGTILGRRCLQARIKGERHAQPDLWVAGITTALVIGFGPMEARWITTATAMPTLKLGREAGILLNVQGEENPLTERLQRKRKQRREAQRAREAAEERRWS